MRIRVVLPAPRKPVTMVMGIGLWLAVVVGVGSDCVMAGGLLGMWDSERVCLLFGERVSVKEAAEKR